MLQFGVRMRILANFLSLSLLGCLLVVIDPVFTLGHHAFTLHEVATLRKEAKEMFYHAYNNYKEHAFPWDELMPLSCKGRRWDRRVRGNIDDVLGGYSLTLIDAMPTLAVLDDQKEFEWAVRWVSENVSFDRDVDVSVFEVTIRVLGGLLSAHQLAVDPSLDLVPNYDGKLLALAVDLADRLLPSFDTATGIPQHRVNLKYGKIAGESSHANTAGATTLMLEFGTLSRLSGNPVYEKLAKKVIKAIWVRKSKHNLVGQSIDIQTGQWVNPVSSIGAGVDSFYEYLLKGYILFGDQELYHMFNKSYSAVEEHLKYGNWHVEVDMNKGKKAIRSLRVSALQAFWPGLQVLAGKVTDAAHTHHNLYLIWKMFDAMPEVYDIGSKQIIDWAVAYPLRPELLESTYHLYQATANEFYLDVAIDIMKSLQRNNRVKCGFAAMADVRTHRLEDRMESFFLSETVKYLYLLFDSAMRNMKQGLPQRSLSYSRDVNVSVQGYFGEKASCNCSRTGDKTESNRELEDGLVCQAECTLGKDASHGANVDCDCCLGCKASPDSADPPATASLYKHNPVAQLISKGVFTTEGHVLFAVGNNNVNTSHTPSARNFGAREKSVFSGNSYVSHGTCLPVQSIRSSCQQNIPFASSNFSRRTGKAAVRPSTVHIAFIPSSCRTQSFLPLIQQYQDNEKFILSRVSAEGVNADFGPSFNELPGFQGIIESAGKPMRKAALACSTVDKSLSGKIALVERGECPFMTKAHNVMKAGATAMIVYDTAAIEIGRASIMSSFSDIDNVTIPSTLVPHAVGKLIRQKLKRGEVHVRIWSNEEEETEEEEEEEASLQEVPAKVTEIEDSDNTGEEVLTEDYEALMQLDKTGEVVGNEGGHRKVLRKVAEQMIALFQQMMASRKQDILPEDIAAAEDEDFDDIEMDDFEDEDERHEEL